LDDDVGPSPVRPGGIILLITGVVLLIAGLLVVEFALLVADLASRSAWLGYVTAAFFVVALTFCVVGIWRELIGIFSLRSNERWRRSLDDQDTDLTERKRIVGRWLSLLDPKRFNTAEVLRALDSVESPEELENQIRDVERSLQQEARQASNRAAKATVVAKMLLEAPALESVIFLFFTLRLLRQIADMHGLRPGFVVSLVLYRRALLDSSLLFGVDLAADAVADVAADNKLIRLLGSRIPGAGLSFLRMRRFGKVAALACCPLPTEPRLRTLRGTAVAAAAAMHGVAATSIRSGRSGAKALLRAILERARLPMRLRRRAK
jgi:putative membrane protein